MSSFIQWVENGGDDTKNEVFRFSKFLLVGIANTMVGYGTMWIAINLLNLNYLESTLIGYLIGIVVSYLMNSRFTFQQQLTMLTGLKFLVVFLFSYGVAYAIGILIIHLLFTEYPRLSIKDIHSLSSLLSMPCYTILNYLGNAKFTFCK